MNDLASWNFGGRLLAFAATIFMCVATVVGCSEKPAQKPQTAPAPRQAETEDVAVRDVPSAETAVAPKATKKQLSEAEIEQAKKALAAHGVKFHMYFSDSGMLEFEDDAFEEDGSIKTETLQQLKALLPYDFTVSADLRLPQDVTISQIAELPYIDKVYLHRTEHLTDASMVSLAKLPHLNAVSLGDESKITDVGLAELGNMKKLDWLLINMSAVKTDGSFLASLDKHPALKELDIDAEVLADDAYAKLTSLPALETLSISPCHLTGEGLAFLKHCPRLKSLSLELCVGLSDATVDSLAPEAPLEKVSIAGNSFKDAELKLTDHSLEVLAQFKTLTQLRLEDCPSFTNEGVKTISRLTNLESLQLHNCKQIGDAAMPHIATLTNLRELGLIGSQVTKEGLQQLVKLKTLVVINAKETAITADDVQAIKEQMPGLKNIHISK